ncbi:MAG: hypothetical protein WC817_01325 [Patescibacteria group bacterium]|jgi:hypothetical protein
MSEQYLDHSFTLKHASERDELLKRYAKGSQLKAKRERRAAGTDIYSIYDIYDSSLEGIEDYFRDLIPGYDRALVEADFEQLMETKQQPPRREFLRKYVESELTFARGKAVAVELGGPGSRWSQNFTPGFFQKTFGLTLEDLRSDEQKAEDTVRHHEVIPGDMLQGDSLQILEEQVGPRGVHLFLERMALYGISNIPPEPVFIGEYLQRLYRLQAEKGIILAEIPLDEMVVTDTYAWFTKLRTHYPGKFNTAMNGHGFRLQRLSGSPEELPLLSAKELKRSEKLYTEHGRSREYFIEHVQEVLD